DFPGFLNDFQKIPVHGYSVTIPHKETAAEVAVAAGESVEEIRAANTLVRDEKGFIAYNTDYPAAIDALLSGMPTGPDGIPPTVHSRAVLLLGAGGVARALAHGLKEAGALLSIANRTYDRAHRLAEEVGCRAVDWEARHSNIAEIVINCTPVGMSPNLDESPLHPSFLKPGLVVMDTIYNPETTLLVKEARLRGCHVITGVDMFVRQAGLQFKLFTGQDAPLDLMRKVVKRALSP